MNDFTHACTTDIWFAAFLRQKGCELVDFTVITRGKGRYVFAIDGEKYKAMKLEFIRSELSSMKQTIEELKDLLY